MEIKIDIDLELTLDCIVEPGALYGIWFEEIASISIQKGRFYK